MLDRPLCGDLLPNPAAELAQTLRRAVHAAYPCPEYLGVQAAVGAGLGVALMATLGQTPEMLVVRDDLPRPEPIPLTVRHRPGLAGEIPRRAAAALRRLLATVVTTPNLAKGA